MKTWRDAVVSSEITLSKAVEILESAGLRIVLVADSNNKLLGTLTDGDVRRALLRHLSLNTPVENVMNAQPKTAKVSWSRERIISILDQYKLLQIPLVDENNVIVGLTNLQDVINKKRYDNPVFLMAGGFGTRLRPLTDNCPKPMLKIGDKPILEQIMLKFIQAGFHRFYISTHYRPEIIMNYFGDGEKWDVSITYIYEKDPLGTGGALGLLPHDDIDLPLFVMNGDLLTSVNLNGFLEFHESQSAIATMCVREYEHQVPYGVIKSDGIQVEAMTEKPVHRFFVNAGIYLLEPEFVRSVPINFKVDMPTLLETEIASNGIVNIFPVHEYWLDVGRIEDFKRAQHEFSSDGSPL